MLQRLAIISLAGLMAGSAALADPTPNNEEHREHRNRHRRTEFSCVFEGFGKGEPVCRAFGRFEMHRERRHHDGPPGPPAAEIERDHMGRWRGREGEMRVVCAAPKAGEHEVFFGRIRPESRLFDRDDFDDDRDHERNRCEELHLCGFGLTEPRLEIHEFDMDRSNFSRAELSLEGPRGGRLRMRGECELRTHRDHDDDHDDLNLLLK